MKNRKRYIIFSLMAVLVIILPISLAVFFMFRETVDYDGGTGTVAAEEGFDVARNSIEVDDEYKTEKAPMMRDETAPQMMMDEAKADEGEADILATENGRYSATYINSAAAIQEKLIVYNNMTIETKDFNHYINSLEDIVVKSGAYIQEQNVYNGTLAGDEIKNAYYMIRVPKDKVTFFSENLNTLEGKITKQEVNIENVTQRYLDVQRRVNINEAKEERLTKLLKKAENIKDLITIEKEIAQLVTERESMQTELIELEHNIKYDYYSLHVNEVREYQEVKVEKSFGADIDYTFESSIKNFVVFLQNVVLFFVYTWIIWLVSIIVAIVVVIIVKNKLKKKHLENKRIENKEE